MGDSVKQLRYADVAINLGDPVFTGVYHGKKVHDNDLDDIIQRALDIGCQKLMVTGSDLDESRHAVELAKAHPGICYATVGVHPCQAKLFDSYPEGPEQMLQELRRLALEAKESGHATAFGEIGLDYDRLFFSPKDQQLKYFEAQLDLAVEVQLPLFLHSRAASEDFERLLTPRLAKLPKGGLVHSFTGTMGRDAAAGRLRLDIGCEIRPSHASYKHLEGAPVLPKSFKKEKWQKGCMVKGRNEPVTIYQVAHVIASVKGLSVEEVCETTWQNSIRMFALGET
ncbi:conserved hypothetical protein [Histoplasma mississippiense (nom. inval.)]|uniref:conserved hypothetical protein n=1 Tax=Ajellomyces capsulatus (strain NAm1 / WU24) TaxID=2059318 RepID=UPI000157CA99|nr:conserved hypothetical protein [Histoplasma mississippiense (nom. inval.)]EDN09102.1 conserved hypothetical protein [Histoplasma mississippiense (nom. inval.)]